MSYIHDPTHCTCNGPTGCVYHASNRFADVAATSEENVLQKKINLLKAELALAEAQLNLVKVKKS